MLWFAVFPRKLMFLWRSIAIDLGRMVEHLDADLDRARITFADGGLQIHQQVFAAHGIEFAKLLHFQSWLPSNGFPECLVAGLTTDGVVRGERDALGDCYHRLRLRASNAADLFRDGVEGKAHSFQMDGLGFDSSSPKNRFR